MLNNLQMNTRAARLRSSVSESSGYETGEPTESPLPNSSPTHCSSAGMLFNTTSLSVNNEPKNRIKFGPEDILETTNPMLLFSSDLADESVAFSKRSSRRRRKSSSSNKKETDNSKENPSDLKSEASSSTKDAKPSKALSNVTNTLVKKVASSSKFLVVYLSIWIFGLANSVMLD